jgi:hypothetical protein
MILFDAMPEEPAAGHLGRIRQINHVPRNSVESKLRSALHLAGHGVAADCAMLDMLALAAGKASEEYARCHSLIAASRVAAKEGECHEYGSASEPRNCSMAFPKDGAFLCRQCAADDLLRHGFSWFRRSHQLIGVDWCPVHQEVLMKVNHADPFSKSPAAWVSSERLEQPEACAVTLAQAPSFVRRYVEIAVAQLARSRPISSLQLRGVLGSEATQAGLRIGQHGSKPPLSDKVRQIAPAGWLQRHIPGLVDKPPMTSFGRLDVLAMSRVARGDSYLVALAALFPTSSTAIAAYEACGSTPSSDSDAVPRRRGFRHRGCSTRKERFWDGGVWSTYLDAEGSHALMSVKLGVTKDRLVAKLNSLGLPDLQLARTKALWSAINDFGAGMSLEDAACKHGHATVDLETLLRQGAGRMISAVAHLRSPGEPA